MRYPSSESGRARLWFAWLLTALLVTVYFLLPDGDPVLSAGGPGDDAITEPRKLDVVEVSPSDVSPGSAVRVSFVGAENPKDVRVYLGKEELGVLARRGDSIVVRLPSDAELGRAKLRVATFEERSKPYDIRIKPSNFRKPFRSLVGGLALLLFGIGVFARGARAAAGAESARLLARVAGRGPAVLGLGAGLGALAQSTTAAAGLLGGLVASSLLAAVPAAQAFLGAGLGAASAPLITGLIDSREGLLIIALGVLWLGFASDRRARALARLVLGIGLLAFGLQTLRPGFEPFVHDPTMLSLIGGLQASGGFLSIALAALIGALLVALFQGPAPVVVLVLVLAETTAQWDLRTALAVLAGSGLGSAIGALLTIPRGGRGRRLAELYLVLGVLGTLFTAASVDVWAGLADLLVPGIPHEVEWGKRVLLPNLGLHLGVAFALSQAASALLLTPLVPALGRWLERLDPEVRGQELRGAGSSASTLEEARHGLLHVLSIEREGLLRLSELALDGRRDAGRYVEHRLADAHARLDELLEGPVLGLPSTLEGSLLSRAAFANLGLLRALEALHRQAERLTDARLALTAGSGELLPFSGEDLEIAAEMQKLLESGLSALEQAVAGDSGVVLEDALSRELRMNGLEARARGVLQRDAKDAHAVQRRLRLLELIDVYEAAGNQLFRALESLAEWGGVPAVEPAPSEEPTQDRTHSSVRSQRGPQTLDRPA